MPHDPDGPIISAMTPPSASKLILALDTRRRTSDGTSVPIKRYRLARLNFDTPESEPQEPFGYLKRTFD